MITKEKRSELRELYVKATPMPWEMSWNWMRIDAYNLHSWAETPRIKGDNFEEQIAQARADKEFAESTINAIIPLLDELERVEGDLENTRTDRNKLAQKYVDLTGVMPCGHQARYAVHEDGGEWCALCELYAERDAYSKIVIEMHKRIAELEAELQAVRSKPAS